MRIKICGITQSYQATRIAELGATALGFICVQQSPRYVTPEQIYEICHELPAIVDRIGVVANAQLSEIDCLVSMTGLTGVQLHGDESPEFCRQLRQIMPLNIELIKAFRIKTRESLLTVNAYLDYIDTILLDAYDPQVLGGTGKTLYWQDLQQFRPNLPWILAGGLTPDNVTQALSQLDCDGIDLSSGVEKSPGDKDLDKVAKLFESLVISH
jgi:phosphoribosylanthranilate isomerase